MSFGKKSSKESLFSWFGNAKVFPFSSDQFKLVPQHSINKTQNRTPVETSSNDIDQSYKLSTQVYVFIPVDVMLQLHHLLGLTDWCENEIGKGMAPTGNQTQAAKPLDPVMAVFQHQLTASDKCLQTECRGGKVFTSYCESKPVSFFHSI